MCMVARYYSTSRQLYGVQDRANTDNGSAPKHSASGPVPASITLSTIYPMTTISVLQLHCPYILMRLLLLLIVL